MRLKTYRMDSGMAILHPSPPIHPRRRNNRTTMHGLQTERLSLSEEAKLEMAALPTKTPVSVLQELLSRRGATPKYELVQIEGAIHQPIFRYRVFIDNDFVANGTGRSKKDAKHAAAKNLLDVLIGKQTPEQANAINGGTNASNDITSQIVLIYDDQVMGNPIGWLQEMCMSRRWPPPFYEMEHEEGLPHERQFTIACQVLKFREIGTGKSKKLAKRMAAHKMWQALQDIPQNGTNANSNLDEDDELAGKMADIQPRYSPLKDCKIPTLGPQFSQKISQFHKALKHMKCKELDELQFIQTTNKDFNCVEFLQLIAAANQFEITYVDIEEKSVNNMYQCLVQLSTLPVAVCYGTGYNVKTARASAAQNALEYLKIMTK